MKIAIDVTPLETGHRDRGVGTYTKLLIDALEKYGSDHSYHFFTRGQKVPKNIDLIHYPYFDPFFVTLPLFYKKPIIITVHDLIPLVFAPRFPAGIRGTLKWQYQRIKLRGAGRIIADSEASKRDIERIVGISAPRIDVIHLAPSPDFQPAKSTSLLHSIAATYNLPKRFILYVGDVNWNKNVLGMLKAYKSVKRKVSSVKLVLVGRAFLEGSREAREIHGFIKQEGLAGDVLRIGGVSTHDLSAIYSLASVYIQPSFYEGFGLPVLEAMICGVPVVCSNVSSLAEIAGPAITVDPGSPEDIARGLREGLTMSPPERSALVRVQTQWAKRFSWERVAQETVTSYEKALA